MGTITVTEQQLMVDLVIQAVWEDRRALARMKTWKWFWAWQ